MKNEVSRRIMGAICQSCKYSTIKEIEMSVYNQVRCELELTRDLDQLFQEGGFTINLERQLKDRFERD